MSPASTRIAELNDLLRTTFLTGRVILTEGIADLPESLQSEIVEKVKNFDAFTPDNDPHGERDFGSISEAEIGRVVWKIDYYDPEYHGHSDDPADASKTRRVLTIMLASEY